MRIYCRGVEIVFVLRISIALPFFVRAVDGPQLAWECSAHIPLSGRYHPLSSRSLRPFCTTRDAARLFVRAHYSCMFLSCAYSSVTTSPILYPAMNTINTNVTCNTTSIIAIMCLIFIYTVNICLLF
jgi:hypothetical protein